MCVCVCVCLFVCVRVCVCVCVCVARANTLFSTAERPRPATRLCHECLNTLQLQAAVHKPQSSRSRMGTHAAVHDSAVPSLHSERYII